MLRAPDDEVPWAALFGAATTSSSRPGCCLPSLPLRARHCATARGNLPSAAWPGPCPSTVEASGLAGNHNMLWYDRLRALVLVSAHHRETFPGLQQAVMRRRTREGAQPNSDTPGVNARSGQAIRRGGPNRRTGRDPSCGRSRYRCARRRPPADTQPRVHAAAR